LYLSEISWKAIYKSVNGSSGVDWNLIDSKSRLYFRTVEDTNKRQFDKDDVVHYNYIDSNNEWKVSNYEPI
jgi:hypothetical protein